MGGLKSRLRHQCCSTEGEPHRAEFLLVGGSGYPDDYTEACEAHLGSLIGTPTWLSQDNTVWHVYEIAEEA